MSQKIQVRRGLAANLPTEASSGELLLTTDTNRLYAGKGPGQSLVHLNPSSSGSALQRYATSSSPNCKVFADGPGVDVVISTNTATITVPVGVNVISMSVYFTAAQIGSNTNARIVMPSTFGIGTDKHAAQIQVFKDVVGSRAQVGTLNFNDAGGTSVLSIATLVANQAIVANITF